MDADLRVNALLSFPHACDHGLRTPPAALSSPPRATARRLPRSICSGALPPKRRTRICSGSFSPAADGRNSGPDSAGRCTPRRSCPQLRALGYPDSPHTRQQLLELVQDALAGKPPVWFILDDVHLLSGGEAAELVSFLAERLPPQAHLILLSRNQIFSEAQKLRLGSRLLELGAADLRLTQEELLQYAGRCGLPLPERGGAGAPVRQRGLDRHDLSHVPRLRADGRMAL